MKLTQFLLLLIVAAFAVAAQLLPHPLKRFREDQGEEEGGEDDDGEEEEGDDEVTLTEDHVRKLHKAIDLNGDGKTSTEEFAQYAKDRYLAKELKYHEEDQKSSKTAHKTKSIDEHLEERKKSGDYDDPEAEKALLAAADENKDGFLDQRELFHYLHLSTDAVLEVEAQIRMKKFDLNQDGSIDFDEFHKQIDRDDDQDPETEVTKEDEELFNVLDKDGDRSLNFAEWRLYVPPYNADQDEAHRLVQKADGDKDGHLDVDELIKSGILDEFDDRPHAEGARSLFQGWVEHHSDL